MRLFIALELTKQFVQRRNFTEFIATEITLFFQKMYRIIYVSLSNAI